MPIRSPAVDKALSLLPNDRPQSAVEWRRVFDGGVAEVGQRASLPPWLWAIGGAGGAIAALGVAVLAFVRPWANHSVSSPVAVVARPTAAPKHHNVTKPRSTIRRSPPPLATSTAAPIATPSPAAKAIVAQPAPTPKIVYVKQTQIERQVVHPAHLPMPRLSYVTEPISTSHSVPEPVSTVAATYVATAAPTPDLDLRNRIVGSWRVQRQNAVLTFRADGTMPPDKLFPAGGTWHWDGGQNYGYSFYGKYDATTPVVLSADGQTLTLSPTFANVSPGWYAQKQ